MGTTKGAVNGTKDTIRARVEVGSSRALILTKKPTTAIIVIGKAADWASSGRLANEPAAA